MHILLVYHIIGVILQIRSNALQIDTHAMYIVSIVRYIFTFICSLVLVPPPQVTVTITPSVGLLYEGTSVTLTCLVTVDTTHVNIPISVTAVWIGPNGEHGEQMTKRSFGRITVADMTQSSPYTSMVMFDPADDIDTGDYQCNVSVSTANNVANVLSSVNSTAIYLNITGELR